MPHSVLPSCRSLERILPPRDAEGSNLPPRFWAANQPLSAVDKTGNFGRSWHVRRRELPGLELPTPNVEGLRDPELARTIRGNALPRRLGRSIIMENARPKAGETCFTIERACRNLADLSTRSQWIFPSFLSRRLSRETYCANVQSVTYEPLRNQTDRLHFFINFLTLVGAFLFLYFLFYRVDHISMYIRMYLTMIKHRCNK